MSSRSSELRNNQDTTLNSPLSRIREQQFVDDAEMSEILANENLLKRLQKGAREAKTGKGRFVG